MHFQTFYLKYTFFESYFSGRGGRKASYTQDTFVIECNFSLKLLTLIIIYEHSYQIN